ncbi:hypothetical protein [Streptomyces ipomoeae]|uniref:hypothetical protein n=1 Tax=Streptomyces ipomoeae TaxID=103232 RepID=UPI0011474FEC|nr:hypothetical protein [Streptomyces ipomoeae]TQE35451.1 hypothetical protein Sipo7851_14410 [Streptomyces ipomoeae]
MRRPIVRRTDPRLETITKAIERLIPGAAPARLTVTVTETLPGTTGHDGEPHKHTWTGRPDSLAETVFTALYGRPRTRPEDAERELLDTITRALTDVRVTDGTDPHDLDGPTLHLHGGTGWVATIPQAAVAIYTALYGRPRTEPGESPLARAEDAKRRRDLVGELSALMSAGNALESAPWYPCRHGDVVHVHYEATPTMPACGETYIVRDAGEGLMSLRLLADGVARDAGPFDGMTAGALVVEAADCPIYELWFEAGPQRLTVVRDGRVVHNGGAR